MLLGSCTSPMAAAQRQELYQIWQTAFSEWHRHKTDATAEAEIKARQAFVSLCKEARRQSRQNAVG